MQKTTDALFKTALSSSPLSADAVLNIGINEHLVAAGYHPGDFDRWPDRAGGGLYPPRGTVEWQLIEDHWRVFREHIEEVRRQAA